MSNSLLGSTGKLTLGSVEPGSGLGKREKRWGEEKIKIKTESGTSPGPRQEL